MPRSEGRGNRELEVRRLLTQLVALPRGASSKPVEQVLRAVSRRLLNLLTLAEVALLPASRPPWVTQQAVQEWMRTGTPSRPASSPTSSSSHVCPGPVPNEEVVAEAEAPGIKCKYLLSRACDRHISLHRESLREAALQCRHMKKYEGKALQTVIHSVAWRRFPVVPGILFLRTAARILN